MTTGVFCNSSNNNNNIVNKRIEYKLLSITSDLSPFLSLLTCIA